MGCSLAAVVLVLLLGPQQAGAQVAATSPPPASVPAFAEYPSAWAQCPPPNAGWLEFAFTFKNPGAVNCTWVVGAPGAATILTDLAISGEPQSATALVYGATHAATPAALHDVAA